MAWEFQPIIQWIYKANISRIICNPWLLFIFRLQPSEVTSEGSDEEKRQKIHFKVIVCAIQKLL